MFSSNQSFNLLIGKSISRTASVQVTDPSTTATYLADGEVLVLDEDGAVMTAGQTLSDTRYIQVVQRSGATTNPLIFSARIDGNNVKSFTGKSYVAPQEQIHYVGYNGSSGAIDGDETTVYKLRVQFKHNKDMWSEQLQQRYYEFTPDSSTVGKDVAASFATQISDDTDVTEIKVERICNDAGAAEGDTATVTNGSTTVTMTGTTALVAGSYVRFGTAVTDPVYMVESETNTGTNLVLDQPYQGTSASSVTIETITEALADAANFGLKFTGKALTFTLGKFKFTKVMFDVLLKNFGTTAVTKSQEAKKGSGTYEEIAELEWMAVGYDGNLDKIGDTAIAPKADATSGAVYDVIGVTYFDASEPYNTISGAKASPQLLLVAMVDGAAQTGNVLSVLNPWMASLPGAFAPVAV